MIAPAVFIKIAVQAAMAVLLISMAMVLWRMARGPGAADRVVAMDLLSVLVLAFLVAFAAYSRRNVYLDVAIAYACIAFLGAIALARFLMRAYNRQRCENREEKLDE